ARTASRLYAPAPGVLNNLPARVTDLASTGAADTSITIAWTATGADSLHGRPATYDVRASVLPLDSPAEFELALLRFTFPATVDAGQRETATLGGLRRATTYHVALRAVNAQGELSAISNAIVVTTQLVPGLRLSIASLAQPARVPITLTWQGGRVAPEAIA